MRWKVACLRETLPDNLGELLRGLKVSTEYLKQDNSQEKIQKVKAIQGLAQNEANSERCTFRWPTDESNYISVCDNFANNKSPRYTNGRP